MTFPIRKLQAIFGDNLQENVRLSNYTTSRIGGPVPGLLSVNTLKDLSFATNSLWSLDVPFRIIGSGSNILVSDKGYEGIILVNRCHNIKIQSQDERPSIYAESGANFSNIARQSALRGLTGMEWSSNIPGSIGGALYGNAGAFGNDVSHWLRSAQVLFKEQGEKTFTSEQFGFTYRSSAFKREHSEVVILSAVFNANHSTREESWKILGEYTEKRQATQPAGASIGSTFKNPPGNYAGRLIEAVGLKGHAEGHAHFSQMHANFIVNDGNSSAHEYLSLIKLAQTKVKEQFGIDLELEIELLGEFEDE
ncbi:MAG: UDP-N-acetylmuramate dehydrogenase [Anaerolineaceae bacterium]